MKLMSYLQKDAHTMDRTIRKGPMTLILVFSTSCPHCHTYMPIWKKLCQTKGRKTNMISMESSVYQQTPMAQKKPVSGVPTVLYVNKDGEVVEVDEPRNKTVMTSVIRNAPPSFTQVLSPKVEANTVKPVSVPSPKVEAKPSPSLIQTIKPNPNTNPNPNPNPIKPLGMNQMKPLSSLSQPSPSSAIPGTEVEDSPLKPIPAFGGSYSKDHRGGNWNTLMAAAQQAAPAAALLGAYAAFPMKRSSGLGPARSTRKRSKRSLR